VTKKGLSSNEAADLVAKSLGKSRKEIGMAGLKDKHALTKQMMSIDVGDSPDMNDIKESLTSIETDNLIIKTLKLHTNKLKKGHLLGNGFRILVSGLDEVENAYRKAEKIISKTNQTGIPNYFGPQRFGAHGSNAIKGMELLEGERKEKNRFLRGMFISAFQSDLCNQYLAERIGRGLFSRIIRGDIAKKHDTGGIFVVEDEKKGQVRSDSREISFTAPIYGRKMRWAENDSESLEKQILEKNSISDKLLSSMPHGTRRMGRLIINDLEIKREKEGILVAFTLPKGAYATTVLREIMK
jgi:tRNA pseudouridine13 synthase